MRQLNKDIKAANDFLPDNLQVARPPVLFYLWMPALRRCSGALQCMLPPITCDGQCPCWAPEGVLLLRGGCSSNSSRTAWGVAAPPDLSVRSCATRDDTRCLMGSCPDVNTSILTPGPGEPAALAGGRRFRRAGRRGRRPATCGGARQARNAPRRRRRRRLRQRHAQRARGPLGGGRAQSGARPPPRWRRERLRERGEHPAGGEPPAAGFLPPGAAALPRHGLRQRCLHL